MAEQERRPATVLRRGLGRDQEAGKAYRAARDAWSRAAAACERAGQLQLQAEQVLAESQSRYLALREARRAWQQTPARRQLLQHSEHARLVARAETMPVIEQAKGIIMAQSRCGAAAAFDLLRRASQRSNMPVRELAAQIVARAAGAGLTQAS